MALHYNYLAFAVAAIKLFSRVSSSVAFEIFNNFVSKPCDCSFTTKVYITKTVI